MSRTKRFMIEVEPGETDCQECPYKAYRGNGCSDIQPINCIKYDLTTIKIEELKDPLPLCYTKCEMRLPDKPNKPNENQI